MPQLNHNQLIAQFQEFRQKLYYFFAARRDSIMDLLDVLAGNKEANKGCGVIIKSCCLEEAITNNSSLITPISSLLTKPNHATANSPAPVPHHGDNDQLAGNVLSVQDSIAETCLNVL